MEPQLRHSKEIKLNTICVISFLFLPVFTSDLMVRIHYIRDYTSDPNGCMVVV